MNTTRKPRGLAPITVTPLDPSVPECVWSADSTSVGKCEEYATHRVMGLPLCRRHAEKHVFALTISRQSPTVKVEDTTIRGKENE